MNDILDLTQSIDEPATLIGADREPFYPEATLEHPDLIDLPNTGKAVIEHEVVERTQQKKRDGNHTHRVRIRIKSIRPMGRRKHPTNRLHASESAMRDLMG